jgi:hypothetical protein
MLTRRIVASACALCLALPAVASAKDVRYVGHVHHVAAIVVTGDTKGDLPGSVAAVPPGDTKGDVPGTVAPTPASHNTAVAPRPASQPRASTDDATNSWRLAAVIEGGLLAALAAGAAVLMTGRRQQRAPRMGV